MRVPSSSGFLPIASKDVLATSPSPSETHKPASPIAKAIPINTIESIRLYNNKIKTIFQTKKCVSYSSNTSLIPIEVSIAKTNACTTATKRPCIYKTIGIPTTILFESKDTNNPPNPKNNTFNNIHHEDIFPNNLIESEIILEINPTISSNPTNNEMIISPSLVPNPFPSIICLPVIGTYS